MEPNVLKRNIERLELFLAGKLVPLTDENLFIETYSHRDYTVIKTNAFSHEKGLCYNVIAGEPVELRTLIESVTPEGTSWSYPIEGRVHEYLGNVKKYDKRTVHGKARYKLAADMLEELKTWKL